MGSHHSDRRRFLTDAALASMAVGTVGSAAAQTPAPTPATPAARLKETLAYGQPSRFDTTVRRTLGAGSPINDTALTTPLQDLDGIITPSGLHFLMDHVNGIPDIDPKQHKLLVHGFVARPLAFTLDELKRFPSVSKVYFLPTRAELDTYITRLKGYRDLPAALKTVLEQIPADAHPMDVMRTGCSMLGNLETEHGFAEQHDHIDRMLGCFPSIICYWYRYSHDGVRIDTRAPEVDSIGGHFLTLLRGEKPNELHERVMNVSLILYAEHEFNASTFAARVCASTLSDIHSSVTAAIGTLRGPLHGGANEAAMEMIENWTSADEAEREILGKLERKEKIMGFGHAIYRESDPRND
jgi:citrate synthase